MTKFKRLCAMFLALALILTGPFVVQAFAATYDMDWTDSTYRYEATLTTGSTSTKRVIINSSSAYAYHVYGTATTISVNVTVTCNANAALASKYSGKIGTMLSNAGRTDTVSVRKTFTVIIPASAATGDYYATAIFSGSPVSVTVNKTYLSSGGAVSSEDLYSSFTPASSPTVTTGYYCTT